MTVLHHQTFRGIFFICILSVPPKQLLIHLTKVTPTLALQRSIIKVVYRLKTTRAMLCLHLFSSISSRSSPSKWILLKFVFQLNILESTSSISVEGYCIHFHLLHSLNGIRPLPYKSPYYLSTISSWALFWNHLFLGSLVIVLACLLFQVVSFSLFFSSFTSLTIFHFCSTPSSLHSCLTFCEATLWSSISVPHNFDTSNFLIWFPSCGVSLA